MAAVTRQPFAPLDGARLQNLTSLKNRQNASPLGSGGKRKAELFEADDAENVDPSLSAKRSKADGHSLKKPAYVLTRASNVSTPRHHVRFRPEILILIHHSPPLSSPAASLLAAFTKLEHSMASINDLATAAIASSSGPGKRGAFIVLEGLDRSGKTTQAKLLEQRFVEAGRPVKVMRFPDRSTPIGQMIDGYLKSDVEMEDHAIHLLFSANRWEAAQIHALLAGGTTIICDRFYHSGMVYSAAKRNPSLPLSWARAPERGLPRPDAVLFLDLDEDQARARGGWGGEVYERADMQRRVRRLFWALVGKQPPQGYEDGDGALVSVAEAEDGEDLVIVDAGGSVEDVAEDIWRRVEDTVRRVDKGELGDGVRQVR
ncbi:hypothetical protein HIM_09344 [Hirsutella minnesotensis 3608]|uniref:Thymidylate kinase n=1 Tax=Hirsutella minnesotensis 3608 TaxID=1043627 RepID=A0A0F7ZGP9_9HYPO|nr:hypothetical protein HIM_09344 [Hirsutella minnesotensis 3608]